MYSYLRKGYQNAIDQENFESIAAIFAFDDVTSNANDSLSLSIKQYNLNLSNCMQSLNDKNNKIVSLYYFLNNQRRNLIEIQKIAHQEMAFANNSENFENFLKIKEKSKLILEEIQQFKQWAEYINSKKSLNQKGKTKRVFSRKAYAGPYKFQRFSDLTRELDAELYTRKLGVPLFNKYEYVREPHYRETTQKYFTREETLSHLLSTNAQNELCDHKRHVIKTDYNNEKNNYFIYVMDTHGNLFFHKGEIIEDGIKKCVNHISFTRGKPVACAGTIRLLNGKVNYIDNNSEYYQTGPLSLLRVVEELSNRNVLDDNCQINDIPNTRTEVLRGDTSMISLRASIGTHLIGEYQNSCKHLLGNIISDNNQKLISPTDSETMEILLQISNSTPPDIINLSEKINPKEFLDCMREINLYLNKRAKQTGVFFKGHDYYERRDSFREILKRLRDNPDQAIQFILKEAQSFRKKSLLSNRYADALEKLKSAIEKVGIHTLDIKEVKNRINNYSSIYDSMNQYKEAVNRYVESNEVLLNSNNLFSKTLAKKGAELLSGIAHERIEYKYKLEDIKKNIKNEGFLNDQELKELEYTNLAKLKWF